MSTELGLGDTHFNSQAKSILIVENPIDCLLLQLAWGNDFRVVASLSVDYWFDSWTLALQVAQPKSVLIAYDRPKNDNERQSAARLYGKLKAVGLRVGIFKWPNGDYKDFGEFINAHKVDFCCKHSEMDEIDGHVVCLNCGQKWQTANEHLLDFVANFGQF